MASMASWFAAQSSTCWFSVGNEGFNPIKHLFASLGIHWFIPKTLVDALSQPVKHRSPLESVSQPQRLALVMELLRKTPPPRQARRLHQSLTSLCLPKMKSHAAPSTSVNVNHNVQMARRCSHYAGDIQMSLWFCQFIKLRVSKHTGTA